MPDKEKLIIRREPKRNGGALAAFYPETGCLNRGRHKDASVLGLFVEHSGFVHHEVERSYYLSTHTVDYEEEGVKNFVATIEKLLDYKVELVKRVNWDAQE